MGFSARRLRPLAPTLVVGALLAAALTGCTAAPDDDDRSGAPSPTAIEESPTPAPTPSPTVQLEGLDPDWLDALPGFDEGIVASGHSIVGGQSGLAGFWDDTRLPAGAYSFSLLCRTLPDVDSALTFTITNGGTELFSQLLPCDGGMITVPLTTPAIGMRLEVLSDDGEDAAWAWAAVPA